VNVETLLRQSKSSHSNCVMLFTWVSKAYRFQGLGDIIHFKSGEGFCFYCMFKTFFSGHHKVLVSYSTRGYRPEGISDDIDQSFTKAIVRNDERLYSLCQHSLSKSLEFHEFVRCYAKDWDQNINHCYLIRLCVGFHGAKFSQVSSSSGMK